MKILAKVQKTLLIMSDKLWQSLIRLASKIPVSMVGQYTN